MVMLLLAAVLAAVFLWSVSIGAVLEIRREERRGLQGRCPAWVPLGRADGALYRCGVPVRRDAEHCGQHASPDRRAWASQHPEWERIERTRAAADAASKLRWGVPLATICLLTVLALAVAYAGWG